MKRTTDLLIIRVSGRQIVAELSLKVLTPLYWDTFQHNCSSVHSYNVHSLLCLYINIIPIFIIHDFYNVQIAVLL